MNRPSNNISSGLALAALLISLVALVLAVRAGSGDGNTSNSNEYLNRSYTFSYISTEHHGTTNSSLDSGVLISFKDGVLVFSNDISSGGKRYKAISASSLLDMYTDDNNSYDN